MSVKYVCYAVTIAVFYDFFCRWHSMMNWPCYNKFFGNVIRVIFTQWKHLEPRVNVSNWYCFKAVKRYICHYLMKSVSIPRNGLWNIQLSDAWWYYKISDIKSLQVDSNPQPLRFKTNILLCKLSYRVWIYFKTRMWHDRNIQPI